jgi:hypothetical protein
MPSGVTEASVSGNKLNAKSFVIPLPPILWGSEYLFLPRGHHTLQGYSLKEVMK